MKHMGFLRFLNAIMYPHKNSFMATVSEYIDYSDNETLWKGVTDVSTIEEIKYAGMREELTEEFVHAMILDYLEEQIPEERIIIKIQRYFNLTKEKAEEYYKKYAGNFD